MTVDANGSIHDQDTGRFAGTVQHEADTDTVLPSTAGLLASMRNTPRRPPTPEPVDYDAVGVRIRELVATTEPHPMTCRDCGANPRMGNLPCPVSLDHTHHVTPLATGPIDTITDWADAEWKPTDEDPDIITLDIPGGLAATIAATIAATTTKMSRSADYDLPHTRTDYDWELAEATSDTPIAAGSTMTVRAAQRAAQAAWRAHLATTERR